MNMLEQVIFLLEGEYDTGMMRVNDGLPYRRIAFQDVYWRWENDRLTATDCLAIIYFSICGIGTTDEAGVLDAWSAELRTAAETKEIRARNPATLLPFNVLPDGWDWLVSIDDCDKLLKARGLDWQISTVVEHIAGLLFHMPTNEAAATSGAPENAAPPAQVVADAGTTGMVAWQAAILENLNTVIIPKKGDKTPARHVLMWCRLHGPRDVFPIEQPNERDSFVWRDKAGGGLHTVQIGTVNNVWSGWRKAGKLTV